MPAPPTGYSSLGVVLSLVALVALLVAVVAVALCYRHRQKGKESRHLAVAYTAGQMDTSDYVVPGEPSGGGDAAPAPVTPLHHADACSPRCSTEPPCALLLQPQLPYTVPVHAASPWPQRPGQGQLPQGMAQHGMAQCGTQQCGMVPHGAAWHCTVHHGASTVLHTIVLHGAPWFCTVRYDVAWCGTVLHSAS